MMRLLDIPKLEVSNFFTVTENVREAALLKLARSIWSALSTYPHFIVVNGYPAVEDRSNLVDLSQAILDLDLGVNCRDRKKISFTKVRIDRAKISDEAEVTHYSRTHLPLTLHTDSTYSPKPHELVAFQCIVADNQGGESIVMNVDDIVDRLDDEVINRLREPIYPFGNVLYPILFGEKDKPHIRYYRTQIDRIIQKQALALPDKYLMAMESLDTVIESTGLFCQFFLQTGQILFLHN
jgi:hypothetical protein